MWATGSITTGLSSDEDTTLTTWNYALIKHGEKMRNIHKNFIREYERKKPLVRPMIRWEDNIKKLLNGLYMSVWNEFGHGHLQWCYLVMVVVNRNFPIFSLASITLNIFQYYYTYGWTIRQETRHFILCVYSIRTHVSYIFYKARYLYFSENCISLLSLFLKTVWLKVQVFW